MSVQLWWSARPEHESELRVLQRLCQDLAQQPEQFFVFANVPIYPRARKGEQIDLLVFVDQTSFLVELKETNDKPVRGEATGPWVCDSGKVWTNPNPLEQARNQYYALRDWLYENRQDFLPAQYALATDDERAWWDIKKFVVFCPTLDGRSKIELPGDTYISGSKGDVLGEDQLLSRLVNPIWRTHRRPFQFTEDVVREIAFRLRLQPELSLLDCGRSRPRMAPIHEREVSVIVPPASATKGRRRRRLLPWTAILLILLGGGGYACYYYGWPVPHRIEATSAYRYVGRRATVRMVVNRATRCGSSTCVFDMRLDAGTDINFSVEITRLSDPAEFVYGDGDPILVGPGWIKRADSRAPQMEISREDLDRRIRPGP